MRREKLTFFTLTAAAILPANCVPSIADVCAVVTGTAPRAGAKPVRLGTVHVLEPGFFGVNIENAYVSNFL